MCLHNYTQHSGCGHIGESHTQPWTLCDAAVQRLNSLRGPNSPPLSPAAMTYAPPKRTSSTRRFFSLSRSNTAASRRTTSGLTGTSRDSTTSHGSYTQALTAAVNYATLPDHQLAAVKCAQPIKSTHVSREMDVCKTCKRWIDDMRSMLSRYDKTGSIRGTSAFERFLKGEEDCAEDDLTVPLEDCAGARQAIIMGHSENGLMMDARGLEELERELNEKRGFY
jgi:hypothetical protein